eukprot:12438399-Heterocapsa_arctica.AAC.1
MVSRRARPGLASRQRSRTGEINRHTQAVSRRNSMHTASHGESPRHCGLLLLGHLFGVAVVVTDASRCTSRSASAMVTARVDFREVVGSAAHSLGGTAPCLQLTGPSAA